MKEIVLNTIQNPNYLTPAIHKEFWTIINKYEKNLSQDDINYMKGINAGVYEYMRMFYTDALISLKTGNSFKSNERKDYEKLLLKLGVLKKDRVESNDLFMDNVALKKPVSTESGSIILTEDMIRDALDKVKAVSKRIDLLYSR